nr:anthrone oxygenase family protein [Mameliella sp. CS4]
MTLDALDPRIAIPAMQAMNDSVRNAVFAPAFFGTPLVCALAAFAAFQAGHKGATRAFAAAALVYLAGGIGVTIAVNVPMNRGLDTLDVPQALAEA